MRPSALSLALCLAAAPLLSAGAQSPLSAGTQSPPRYQVTPYLDGAYVTSLRENQNAGLTVLLHKSVGVGVRVTPSASPVGFWGDLAAGSGKGGRDCGFCGAQSDLDVSTLRLGGGITYRVTRPGRSAITDLLLGAHYMRLSVEGYGTTRPMSNAGLRFGFASDVPFSENLTARFHLTEAVMLVDKEAYERQFAAPLETRFQHMVQAGIGLSFYLY